MPNIPLSLLVRLDLLLGDSDSSHTDTASMARADSDWSLELVFERRRDRMELVREFSVALVSERPRGMMASALLPESSGCNNDGVNQNKIKQTVKISKRVKPTCVLLGCTGLLGDCRDRVCIDVVSEGMAESFASALRWRTACRSIEFSPLTICNGGTMKALLFEHSNE